MALTLDRYPGATQPIVWADAAHAAALNSANFSIGIDFMFTALPTVGGSAEEHNLLTKGSAGAPTDATYAANYSLSVQNDAGTYKIYLEFADSGLIQAYQTIYTWSAPVINRWYSLAGVWDNTAKTLTLYLALHETATATGETVYTQVAQETHAGVAPYTANTAKLCVGAKQTTGGSIVRGAFALVECPFVYTAAKTKAQLDAHLLTRPTGRETSLEACWWLDDGLGRSGVTTAYDVTTNGHDLTVQNATGFDWAPGPTDRRYKSGRIKTDGTIRHTIPKGAIFVDLGRTPSTITANDADTTRPVENLRNGNVARTYRTNDGAGAKTVVWVFPRPITALAVLILNHNLSSQTDWRIQAHTSDVWGAPSFEEYITPRSGQVLHIFDYPATFKAWRHYTDDAAVPSYQEIGQICLLTTLQMPLASGDQEWVIEDRGVHVETEHSERTPRARTTPRIVSLNFRSLPTDVARRAQEILRGGFAGERIAVCGYVPKELYPGTIYGTLSGPPPRTLAEPSGRRARYGPVRVIEDVA